MYQHKQQAIILKFNFFGGVKIADYILWADRGTGASDIYTVAETLKTCSGAGSVEVAGIGPNIGQSTGLSSRSSGKIGVFQTNGVGVQTPFDFETGIKKGYYHFSKVIFLWPQWIGNQWMTDEQIQSHKIGDEWDWNRQSGYGDLNRKYTAAEFFSDSVTTNIDLVTAPTPEEAAQKICNGNFVGKSGGTQSQSGQSNTSPLLTGDMTFEELVGEICNGIDLLFLVKRNVVVVDDFESIFAEAKYIRDNNTSSSAISEDISLWEMEEDSYNLEINQHGFYNTVIVQYKDGSVKESFDSLVRVYGEVPITYHDPTIDKTTAIMKAKAYLAAHLRDLEMMVTTTMLTKAGVDIGDIVSIENPLTLTNKNRAIEGRDPEFLFVSGVSTNWDGDDLLTTDIECKFAPTSPNKLDVPTSGAGSGQTPNSSSGSFGSNGVSADGAQICAIGKPSAVGESHYGYSFYRSVFENKCPFCGNNTLIWGWNWANGASCGMFQEKGTYECGSIEGHVFCDSCDSDFSCIDGKDHMNPPRATLTRISGPTPSNEAEALKLKNGEMK